jgi:hypothetical protein
MTDHLHRSTEPAPRRWRMRLIATTMALAAGLLDACGSGSGSGMAVTAAPVGCNANTCGASLLTIQDAAGDFQSYTVDVVSLQLTKASGAVVETLPATTRIDFAQLVSLTELVTAGQIPSGDYTGADITLNFASASILADDGNGGSLALAPVDASGAPITGNMTLHLQLDAHHHLVITPGRIARLALDFNLAVSNAVNLVARTVTVNPLIQASLDRPATEEIRVRGGFASADTTAQTYVVNVRPFHLGTGTLGQVTVHVASTTRYEIDGTTYSGAAGLAALALEAPGTMVAAFGTLDTATLSFTATRVLAGTSLGSSSSDRLVGVVVGRSGNTLSVRGGDFDSHDGSFAFLGGPITVTVGTGTKVTSAGDSNTHVIGDISVGQRITAVGTATVNAPAGSATLDATAGRVRLEVTSMWGTAVGTAGSSPLHLQLQAIEGRDPSKFDFTGTGATSATDANPANYSVNTGSLAMTMNPLALQQALQTITAGPARVFGFVVPFGTATTIDLDALTLVSFPQAASELLVNWAAPGSMTAFPGLTAGSSSLSLSLAGVGLVHVLATGPMRTNLLTLPSPPQVVADTGSVITGYSIGHVSSHTIESFTAFSDFVAALSADVTGTTAVTAIAAHGHYDAPSNTLSSDRMAVLLGN